MRNNFYATLANEKIFSVIMLVLGIFVVAMDNKIPTLLMGYMMLCMVGFSVNAIASLRKESMSKWFKYKLTVPVRRKDIVKSYFISQLVWLVVGVSFASIFMCLSILIHGYPFSSNTDILMLFTSGISVNLLMCAIFFPLFYLWGEERNEVNLIISLLCAIGIVIGLVSFINWVWAPKLTSLQILLGASLLLIVSMVSFIMSCPLTSGIFANKEY